MPPRIRTRARIRRRARARVIQALYAWESGAGAELATVAENVWADLGVGGEERAYAARIVRHLLAHRPEIDRALTEVTTNWRLERIGVIERSVLRAAAAELAMQRSAPPGERDAPPRAILQEAVHLAERFGTMDSARFVNGVLDAFARKAGDL